MGAIFHCGKNYFLMRITGVSPTVTLPDSLISSLISSMLEGLAQKKDLIFVRNGDEHTCDEAVSHLRLKLGNTRNRIDTAEQFIDKVASSSSITGKPYIVKMPGKSDENAQPFLHALIAQTDKTVPAQ